MWMKVSAQFADQLLTLTVDPSSEDIDFGLSKKGKIYRRQAEFAVPSGFNVSSIHPDALCLLALLVYGPFSKNLFETSWSVSPEFSEAVLHNLKRHCPTVSKYISPRDIPFSGRDALAFSGGVDSVAALELVGENALPVFMRRITPPGERIGLYRDDAALLSCETVRKSGREISVVDTTMEYAREPVGFSVDWTNAAGAILLSDEKHIRSVSFGMVQESAFYIGHSHFSDLRRRSVYSSWAPLFEAVGVPISLPTSGLSEVVTSKIANRVAEKWFSQSCVRGAATEPCGRCFKCFRKKILDARLSGSYMPAEHFEIAKSSNEVKRRLLEVPIHHENVLGFSLHGLNTGQSEIFETLVQKTSPIVQYGENLDCLEKFNPRGLEYIPEFMRDAVHKRIMEFAGNLTADNLKIIENWETMHLTKTVEYWSAQDRLLALLNE